MVFLPRGHVYISPNRCNPRTIQSKRWKQNTNMSLEQQASHAQYAPVWYYLSAFVLPLTVPLGYYRIAHLPPLLTILCAYGVVPVLDLVVGCDTPAVEQVNQTKRGDHRPYVAVLALWVLVEVILLVWALQESRNAAISSLIWLSMSMGFIGACSINVSHELFHKGKRSTNALARILLVLVCYGHFEVEHTLGHHKHVATPHDPASAKLGQSFYSFFPQSVWGGFCSAARLERERLARHRLSPCGWVLLNRVVVSTMLSVLLMTAILLVYGGRGFLLFVLQAFTSIVLLEKTNYIEHYGLERKRLPSGEFEPVSAEHSWDAPQKLSNYMLFKLQCHADHHMRAYKHYYTLQLQPRAPKLPAGYPAMAVLAMFPVLWRWTMDPKARAAARA